MAFTCPESQVRWVLEASLSERGVKEAKERERVGEVGREERRGEERWGWNKGEEGEEGGEEMEGEMDKYREKWGVEVGSGREENEGNTVVETEGGGGGGMRDAAFQ